MRSAMDAKVLRQMRERLFAGVAVGVERWESECGNQSVGVK
jgi:hypothetical protein